MSVKELEKRLQSYGVQFSGSTKFDLMHLCEKILNILDPVLNILLSQKFPEQAIEYVTYMENDLF